MIKFYTSHCQNCGILKMVMDLHHIEYEEIDDEEIYMPIAREHKILSMPFAEIDGLVVNTKGLQKYIKEITKGE